MATKAQIAAAAKKKAAADAAAAATTTTAAAAPVAAAPGFDPAVLAALVAATNDPSRGFMFLAVPAADALEALLYAETKRDMTDESGAVAARATAAGGMALAALAAPAAPAPAPAVFDPFAAKPAAEAPAVPAVPVAATAPVAEAPITTPSASAFKIFSGVPIPAAKRFGKSSTYPFDSLEVGQAFFVPATTDRPTPAKSLASTVNSAMGRYAVEDGKDEAGEVKYKKTRQFALRNVVDGKDFGHPGVRGAAVWRTA